MEPRPAELVIGSTGYLGRRLTERLAHEDRSVRVLARDPSRAPRHPGVEPVRGDLLTGAGLERALDGCTTAYYLAHAMEPAREGDFAERDRRAAGSFVRAARRAGLERVMYLGGIVPAEGPASPHLASRRQVEEILLEGLPRSTALRASIVVGAGSSPFRILVRLIERLRVLPFPAWVDRRTRPIDERDAIEYLVRTPRPRAVAGRSLDIAGPDVLTYGDMVERIAELMGVGRTIVGLHCPLTSAASVLVSAITDHPPELVRPLMASLRHELLPRDDEAARLYGLRPRSFDRAVEHALAEWEALEPLAAR